MLWQHSHAQEFCSLLLGEICDRTDDHAANLLVDLNKVLPAHERLAFIVFVRDEWSIENGFLTPTLKIKRANIERAYEGLAQQ